MKTKKRWKLIQAHLGLSVDGIAGAKTATAIMESLGISKAVEPIKEQSNNVRQTMIKLAQSQVGVREEPKDSNKGKQVEEYQAATWLEGTGWPWCAAFICYLAMKAKDIEMSEGADIKWSRPRTAGAWDFEDWATIRSGGESAGVFMFDGGSERVQEGDILVYTFSHIGLAVSDQDDNQVSTIEGNTNARGSREGGGVYEQTRQVSQIRSIIRIS